MKRYIIYKNERGVFFVDIATEEMNSMSCQGACCDTFYVENNTFYVENNILYCESSVINHENSTSYDDISFSSVKTKMGTVIYRTNSYDKVKSLNNLKIEKNDPWKIF